MLPSLILALLWLSMGALLARRLGHRLPDIPYAAHWMPVVCGLTGAWVAHRWLAGWHLREWPVLARDFLQVCEAVARIRDDVDTAPVWPQRTAPSAAIAGLAARHLGIIDGLRVSGAVGLFGFLAGICWWTCALAGRIAGTTATAFAIAITPIAVLPRALHLYAPSFAAWVLTAAAATATARRPRPAMFGLTGLGIGASMLLDGRGLPFALAAFGAACVTIFLQRATRPWTSGVALLLPIIASWFGARRWISSDTPSLEVQTQWYVFDHAARAHPETMQGGFLWGHSPLWELPTSLIHLAQLAGSVPTTPSPYTLLLLALCGACVVCCWRDALCPRGVWLVGLITASPFVLTLWQALVTAPHVRLLGGPAAVVAVCAGVLFAAVARSPRARPAPATTALATAIWVLMAVGGALPSALHPGAAWRTPIQETPDVGPLLALKPTVWTADEIQRGMPDAACSDALKRDLEQGHPWGGRGLEWHRRP